MLQLLSSQWDVGPHLSAALLAHHGGHVWDSYQALVRLWKRREAFTALDSKKFGYVQACLAWEGGGKSKMRQTLQLLAEKGFAPLEGWNDPIAQELSEQGVGGMVLRSSLVVGLPPDAWGTSTIGLVPITQSMRLAIATVLCQEQQKTKAQ
jgi:hypothetical protein